MCFVRQTVSAGLEEGAASGVWLLRPVAREVLLHWMTQATAVVNTSESEGQCGRWVVLALPHVLFVRIA
jgi:hypothetical protein